jgi:hypothetical protein
MITPRVVIVVAAVLVVFPLTGCKSNKASAPPTVAAPPGAPPATATPQQTPFREAPYRQAERPWHDSGAFNIYTD